MPTEERHKLLRSQQEEHGEKARPDAFLGGSKFVQPASRFLGVHDLFMKFEGTKRDRKGKDIGWALALMEMLTDTVLYNWVPAWLSE